MKVKMILVIVYRSVVPMVVSVFLVVVLSRLLMMMIFLLGMGMKLEIIITFVIITIHINYNFLDLVMSFVLFSNNVMGHLRFLVAQFSLLFSCLTFGAST